MPEVAIIGTRGYPSYYGGFETAVRKLAPYLAEKGWNVTVYGRQGAVREDRNQIDSPVISRLTPGIESRSLSTLSYGLTSTIDSAIRRPDVALVMNVANGYFLPLLKARGIPSLVNVDGIEWDRAKWGNSARRVFRVGAKFTARWADDLVFDARAIGEYWAENFGVEGRFIPYGGDVPYQLPVPEGLSPRKYVLLVARFVPENTVLEFFRAVPEIARHSQVVIVGSSGYGGELDAEAERLASEIHSVSWLGHLSDDKLLHALWQHAGVYFHGHSVGGTNPALVQAMACGAPILARDTIYNREVLGESGWFVPPSPYAISGEIEKMLTLGSESLEAIGIANQSRASSSYSWDLVCGDYERALRRLIE